jgi:hypothetical protein
LEALLMPGPFQSMVLPALVPVKVVVTLVQLRLLLLPAVTVGGVLLLVIVMVAVLVQPLPASVAVTV